MPSDETYCDKYISHTVTYMTRIVLN